MKNSAANFEAIAYALISTQYITSQCTNPTSNTLRASSLLSYRNAFCQLKIKVNKSLGGWHKESPRIYRYRYEIEGYQNDCAINGSSWQFFFSNRQIVKGIYFLLSCYGCFGDVPGLIAMFPKAPLLKPASAGLTADTTEGVGTLNELQKQCWVPDTARKLYEAANHNKDDDDETVTFEIVKKAVKNIGKCFNPTLMANNSSLRLSRDCMQIPEIDQASSGYNETFHTVHR